MSVSREFLWMLIGTAVVTFIPRTLPLVLISRLKLPGYVMKFLKHVPLAVMTALVAQAVLTEGEAWISPDNLEWAAFIPTLAVALLTRSLLLTVVTGVVCAALLAWLPI
ncbi:putative membrane protein [Thermobacillus composti KWC4]|uniref:Putative membrane protein n=1 Tax=Thermobacillus composti (strain DSM 18247 / JCM 13945 / KWC4) TaxID=717605 RepID=L0EBC8_THECK|nr:AzlD domain-containing protein [Thermobacillus composti]AGA56991.1 putative membrane protein [Thermobacillus composti KWC4]